MKRFFLAALAATSLNAPVAAQDASIFTPEILSILNQIAEDTRPVPQPLGWHGALVLESATAVDPAAQGRWVVQALRGQGGALDVPIDSATADAHWLGRPDQETAIVIGADGTVRGHLDCNHHGPRLEIDADGIVHYWTISPGVSLMGCLPVGPVLSRSPHVAIGVFVTAALADAEHAEVSTTSMTLFDAAGEIVARFTR